MRFELLRSRTAWLLMLLVSCFSMAACSVCGSTGCFGDQVAENLQENTVLKCSDGIDNDGDTIIDCGDADCLLKGTAENPGPGDVVCPCVLQSDGSIKCAENTAYACSDNKDNDGNGYIDCQDNNCKKTSVCCIKTGMENTPETCADGIDNDCNGYLDCRDNNCKTLEICCPGGAVKENTEETCSDALDNDCNGYIDCNDNGCKQTDYCLQTATANEQGLCDDGRDNDLDGLIDCDDTDCIDEEFCHGVVPEPVRRPDNFKQLSPAERAAYYAYEFFLCTDGVDNDKNSLIDCREYGCQLRALESRSEAENIYKFDCLDEKDAQCSDKLDNDDDGLMDCDEPACKDDPYCAGITPEPAIRYDSFNDKNEDAKNAIREQEKKVCTDGIDNNKNGLIDCQEPACRKYAPEDGFDCPKENCTDRIDNNYDGLVDCNDPQCSTDSACQGASRAEPAKRTPNFAKLPLAERLAQREKEKQDCTDGIDNDKNGLKDCEEYGCKLPTREVWADDELAFIHAGTPEETAEKVKKFLFSCE